MDFSIFDSFVSRGRREPDRVESDHAMATAGYAPFASVLDHASSNTERTDDHQPPYRTSSVDEASQDPPPSHAPADATTDPAQRSTGATEECTEGETNAIAAEPVSEGSADRDEVVAHEPASEASADRDEADVEEEKSTEPIAAPQLASTRVQSPSETEQTIATATEPLAGDGAADGNAANANQQPGSSSSEERPATASASASPAKGPADPTGHESLAHASASTESAAQRAAGADAAAAKATAGVEAETAAAAAEPIAEATTTEETATPSEGERKGTRRTHTADRPQANSTPSGETQKPGELAPAASTPLNVADPAAATLSNEARDAGDTVIARKDAGEAGTPQRAVDLPRSFGLSHQGDMQLSTRAAPADSAGELSHADQTRLLDRVARAIQVAPQRGGVIRLRLNPPELGSLHLEVSVQRGTLSARLETETQVARTLLLDNLPQLRDRLAEQGIRIEQFDVQVGARDADHSQQQSDHSRHQQQAPRTAGQGGRREAAVDTHMASPAVAAVMGPTNLNVVI